MKDFINQAFRWGRAVAILSVPLFIQGCQSNHSSENKAAKKLDTVSITNGKGMRAVFCPNGARLMSLIVPDKTGKPVDVVIGFEDPKDYDSASEPYFGATIGRFGNRIAEGKFSLNGKTYQIPVNNGPNALHGGKQGFQYKKWSLKKLNDSVLHCTLISPDGDMGFPGKLSVFVTYSLQTDGSLVMDYKAYTDAPTVINLTNHAFFNLNGSGSINNHELSINANRFTPVDSTLIPTGELAEVINTPFDFRTPKPIGKDINAKSLQMQYGKGYDHNYVLNKPNGIPAAEVRGDQSGIIMQVFTTEPGLQFYSGNFMQGKNKLRNGPDNFRTAFCLETQHFPDSPNHPEFPYAVLWPGQKYKSHSVYKFATEKD
jgi:aldose 1-epimerase